MEEAGAFGSGPERSPSNEDGEPGGAFAFEEKTARRALASAAPRAAPSTVAARIAAKSDARRDGSASFWWPSSFTFAPSKSPPG